MILESGRVRHFMGDRAGSICLYKIMANQPISLEVTGVNCFWSKIKEITLNMSVVCPENSVYLLTCCIYSSALQGRSYHGSKQYKP